MKKSSLLALLLAVVMLLAAMTGCSAPADGGDADTGATDAGTADTGATDAQNSDAGTQEVEGTDQLRLACIFGGSISDGGWNQDSYDGLMTLKDEYNLDVSYQENVPNSDAANVLRSYAAEGYDLVVSCEQYHTEAVVEVAAEYPDITFGVANGYMGADNVIAVTGTNWQANCLGGVLAGYATKSNKIGILTATESESARMMVAAYKQGASITNPDVEVIHSYVGSFNDTVKGKELVLSMIDQGVDVLLTNAGQSNTGSVEACAQAGIYCIGAIVDMSPLAPETVLASAMNRPSNLLRIIVEGYLNGTLKGSAQANYMGLAEGAEELYINPALQSTIPQDVMDAIEKAKQDIISGAITITLE